MKIRTNLYPVLAITSLPAAFAFCAAAMCAFAAGIDSCDAQIYINEIYFDPPGTTGDLRSEYIELRGPSASPLTAHYLIFLENETGTTGPTAGTNQGRIENIFDLTSQTIGSNGFLTIRQAGNTYDLPASGTTDLSNTGATFTFGSGSSSTIGHTDQLDTGRIENSGFTAMLIDIGPGAAPVLAQDLDEGDNGMGDDQFPTGWTIVDAIGVNSELSDINGRLYADFNFSAGTPEGGPKIEPGAEFVDVGFAEIEYVGRWGSSTGSTRLDWHASNLTNDDASGFVGPADFRQSGQFHDTGGLDNLVESTQGVPYGTQLANTLGAENLFLRNGDFNFNDVVDGPDLLKWQQGVRFGDGDDASRAHGDTHDEAGVLDRIVDGGDLAVWASLFGDGNPSGQATAANVPEPSGLALLAIGWVSLLIRKVKV